MKYSRLLVISSFCLLWMQTNGQTTEEIDASNPDPNYSYERSSDKQYIKLKNASGYSLATMKGNNKEDTLKSVDGDAAKFDVSNIFEERPSQTFVVFKKGVVNSEKLFTVAFSPKQNPNEQGNEITPPTKEPTQIPFPKIPSIKDLSEKNDTSFQRYNRFLFIDATANSKLNHGNRLLKLDDSGTYKKALGLHRKGSLCVFIEGYSFDGTEKAVVSINGSDYSYNKGLSDVYAQLKEANSNMASGGGSNNATSKLEKGQRLSQRLIDDYLKESKKTLVAITSLNINDLYLVENYKTQLIESIGSDSLSQDELKILSEILFWRPKYVSLTSIPLMTDDTDQAELSLSLKTKGTNDETKYDLGSYDVSGGLDFEVNSTLFITNLVNREIYTDSVSVQLTDSTSANQLRAFMDEQKKITLGIGMNAEVSFRTGCMIRPTVSLGFFVPFDEEVTPNVAMGAGLSLNTGKVKLSVSGGPAFGSVNSIKSRYQNVDLGKYTGLTNESLTEKNWEVGWQIGIGLSYNIK